MATRVPVKLMKEVPQKDIDSIRVFFEAAKHNADGLMASSQVVSALAKVNVDISSDRAQALLAEIGNQSGHVSLGDVLQVLVNERKGGKPAAVSKPAPASAPKKLSAPVPKKQDAGAPEPTSNKAATFGQQVQKKQVAYTAKTVESESGAKHTYSEEEAVAFSDHINQTLRGDARLQDRLPLESANDLFNAVEDGLLLIKLINKAVPDTVDERATNNKENLNIFQKNENQNLVVNAAKAIGCKVVNIHNEDLIEGKPHLVLGLVWQIVRIQLLSQISLKNHPELVRLLEDGEELSDLLKLPADQLLLRWINFHLKNAGETRRVHNFGEDLKDSHAYTILLNQIDSSKCDKQALQLNDALERAERVITNSQNLGVESFIRAENIASGNARLNLAFCAQIFNTNPGLVISEEELTDMAGLIDDDSGDTREERVFRMWINSLGIEDLYINNLFEDLRDGVVLLQLYDRIEPGSVQWKNVNRPPKNKYKRLENCNYVVVLGKSDTFGFSLVNVGGVDIADGNKKLILSIVWQMMRMHSLIVLSSLLGNGKKATEQDVIAWSNALVNGAKIASFKDKQLSTSQYFLDLCSAMAPGVVDRDIVQPGNDDGEKESNAKYVISIARKLGACVFLTWEDIVEVKTKMLFTFTASLMAWDQEKKRTGGGGRRGSLLGAERRGSQLGSSATEAPAKKRTAEDVPLAPVAAVAAPEQPEEQQQQEEEQAAASAVEEEPAAEQPQVKEAAVEQEEQTNEEEWE